MDLYTSEVHEEDELHFDIILDDHDNNTETTFEGDAVEEDAAEEDETEEDHHRRVLDKGDAAAPCCWW
jgi:hypothetical protein